MSLANYLPAAAGAEDEVEKLRPWEPAIGIRIFRAPEGDKLQQKYWRRAADGGFEHEWRDVPIVTE
jgi:hypothetical protein